MSAHFALYPARHARMFEYLRQAEQAKLTARRLSAEQAQHPATDLLRQIRDQAAGSLFHPGAAADDSRA